MADGYTGWKLLDKVTIVAKKMLAYDYKTDKYTEQDIADLHARILTIVDQVMSNTDIILKNIEIVCQSYCFCCIMSLSYRITFPL